MGPGMNCFWDTSLALQRHAHMAKTGPQESASLSASVCVCLWYLPPCCGQFHCASCSLLWVKDLHLFSDPHVQAMTMLFWPECKTS